MPDDLRDTILSIFEACLEAQLRAVRRLRETSAEPSESAERARRPPPLQNYKATSQVDMAYEVLKRARLPLHISEIIRRIQESFGVSIDRESLVSSLTKKVARNDRFIRTEKNTFGLHA